MGNSSDNYGIYGNTWEVMLHPDQQVHSCGQHVQIILNPCNVWEAHYCGKKSWPWQTIFCLKNVCVKKKIWKIYCLSVFPKRISSLMKPLYIKEQFFHKFQGSRSKLFQSKLHLPLSLPLSISLSLPLFPFLFLCVFLFPLLHLQYSHLQ